MRQAEARGAAGGGKEEVGIGKECGWEVESRMSIKIYYVWRQCVRGDCDRLTEWQR